MSLITTIIDGIAPHPISGLGGANEGHINGLATDILNGIVGGVVDLSSNHAKVTQAAVPNMTVLVGDGVVYVPNVNYDEFDATTTKFWRVVIEGEAPVTIGANGSGSTRIDLICVKVDKLVTPDEYGSNVSTIIRVPGTPGAGIPATPNNHYVLSEITVINGATSIATAQITDKRSQLVINSDFLTGLADVTSNTTTSVDSEIALFSSTTGKIIKRASGSGIVKSTAGVFSVVTAPSGAIVGDTDTQTLTNKRITKRVGTTASSAAPTPNADSHDIYTITALAEAATIAAPTGTPTDGQTLIIRIKDNGTARALSFNAIYRFSTDLSAPTTTVLSKTLYLGFIYNSADTKWDCVAKLNNF